MIRIAVVDDEKYVCAQLKRSLLEYQFKYNLDFDVDIFLTCEDLYERLQSSMYNVPLVKTQMKKIIVTAKTLYSHPKNVSKIYAALHTDLAW